MEAGILHFLGNKSILITGATGFLGKVLVEKIVRVQPHVKKLYLLMRAPDTNSAMLRFHHELLEKELFSVLKEKFGDHFDALISEKVRVVAGDISSENLGVEDSALLEEMFSQVDVVVNSAATTKFDERYDVSLGINTLGARHVANFCRRCKKLKVLLHVSTAFVCGVKEGLILETPFKMGETPNGISGLDIDLEKKLVEETLKNLEAQDYSQHSIGSAMKQLGTQRARKFGWPNTYVFTKSMGEMVVGQLEHNIPLVIIRPTVVTSTFKDPFPGWVEGVRTIDSLAVGYGRGRITTFLCDPKSVLDLMPVDMAVNAMIVAMVNGASEGDIKIHHVGSSLSNPAELGQLQHYGQRYFTRNPWIDKDGRPVIVGNVHVLTTMDAFHRYMALRYLLPLKGLEMLNTVCCQYFDKCYMEQSRKINTVMRLAELYKPYLFFKGFFDDTSMEKLRNTTSEEEKEMFYFDPKIIDWDDYFINTHIPGLVKRVFRN